MEIEALRQILEISLTVAILVAFLFYGIKRFNAVLENHQDEREKAEARWLDKLDKLEMSHKEERAAKDQIIRDLDMYTRDLTKETYDLMGEFAKQLESVRQRTDAEKEEIKKLILEAKAKANGQMFTMLEIIGEKLGIDDRKFYKTDL